MKLRCNMCQIIFRNSAALQQHKCIVKYDDLPIKELLRIYNSQKSQTLQ